MAAEETELTEVFRALGARDPEQWARSQLQEGIPQLHRFLFLRQAWEQVVDENDDSWIDSFIEAARKNPEAPFSGQGLAIERMLALGVSRSDIVELVRNSQAEMIFSLCYLIEDPLFDEEVENRVGMVGWALVTTDDEFEPTGQTIGGLHESVLETDPTGREMRPRPKP